MDAKDAIIMTIDIEASAAPIVVPGRPKAMDIRIRGRVDRWISMLELHLAFTFVAVTVATPLAVFALSVQASGAPVQRYDTLLSGAYVMTIISGMFIMHSRTILENSPDFVESNHELSRRLSFQTFISEIQTRLQYFYVSLAVRFGSYLNLTSFALMGSGWTDLVWQRYRIPAAYVAVACLCLVSVQSIIAYAYSRTSDQTIQTHLLFRRASAPLLFSAFKFVCGGSLGPHALWVGSERTKQKLAMKKVNAELRAWMYERGNPKGMWQGEKASAGNLRRMVLASLRRSI